MAFRFLRLSCVLAALASCGCQVANRPFLAAQFGATRAELRGVQDRVDRQREAIDHLRFHLIGSRQETRNYLRQLDGRAEAANGLLAEGVRLIETYGADLLEALGRLQPISKRPHPDSVTVHLHIDGQSVELPCRPDATGEFHCRSEVVVRREDDYPPFRAFLDGIYVSSAMASMLTYHADVRSLWERDAQLAQGVRDLDWRLVKHEQHHELKECQKSECERCRDDKTAAELVKDNKRRELAAQSIGYDRSVLLAYGMGPFSGPTVLAAIPLSVGGLGLLVIGWGLYRRWFVTYDVRLGRIVGFRPNRRSVGLGLFAVLVATVAMLCLLALGPDLLRYLHKKTVSVPTSTRMARGFMDGESGAKAARDDDESSAEGGDASHAEGTEAAGAADTRLSLSTQ